jgi:hypothetical protein
VYHNQLPVLTKMLSPDEICNLFITLQSLGLSQVKTSGMGDADDPVYLNTTGMQLWTDNARTRLFINGSVPKFYIVQDQIKDHAVKPIQDIFAFLDGYIPTGMQPYYPDRLSVIVFEGRDEYLKFHQEATQVKTIPWPADVTPLSQNNDHKLYLEGQAASEVFNLTGGHPDYWEAGGVFVDRGVEYTVYTKPLLPDDVIGDDCYFSQCHAPTPFKPSFSCKYDILK